MAIGDAIPNAAQPTAGQGLVLDLNGQLPLAVRQSLPGYEVTFDQITATVNIVSTAEGTPTTIIAGTPKAYDNVPYFFEFYTPIFTPPSTTGGTARALLIQDGASIGRIAYAVNGVTGGQGEYAIPGKYRFTPAAGVHTFGIAAFAGVTTGTPNVGAGTGGSGADVPAFLRVTRV